jgi:hypothetical protein
MDTIEKFEQIIEELSDYQDLKDLRSAKAEEHEAPGKSITEVRKELNI